MNNRSSLVARALNLSRDNYGTAEICCQLRFNLIQDAPYCIYISKFIISTTFKGQLAAAIIANTRLAISFIFILYHFTEKKYIYRTLLIFKTNEKLISGHLDADIFHFILFFQISSPRLSTEGNGKSTRDLTDCSIHSNKEHVSYVYSMFHNKRVFFLIYCTFCSILREQPSQLLICIILG